MAIETGFDIPAIEISTFELTLVGDYEPVELLIALARENMCLACVMCEDYLAAKSSKGRRKVIDRIPEHIAMLQARAANGGVDPEQN